jgi:hypothetical protein
MGSSSGDVVDQILDAVEQMDFTAFASFFTADATVWHNTDHVEMPIDQVIAGMRVLKEAVPSLTYTGRSSTTLADGIFHQHTQTATIDQTLVTAASCWRAYTASEAPGKVRRVEVYIDGQAVKPIFNVIALSMASGA